MKKLILLSNLLFISISFGAAVPEKERAQNAEELIAIRSKAFQDAMLEAQLEIDRADQEAQLKSGHKAQLENVTTQSSRRRRLEPHTESEEYRSSKRAKLSEEEQNLDQGNGEQNDDNQGDVQQEPNNNDVNNEGGQDDDDQDDDEAYKQYLANLQRDSSDESPNNQNSVEDENDISDDEEEREYRSKLSKEELQNYIMETAHTFRTISPEVFWDSLENYPKQSPSTPCTSISGETIIHSHKERNRIRAEKIDKIFKPLIKAIEDNNLEPITKFIENGGSPDYTSNTGYSLLSAAIYYNKVKIVEYLLEKGADPLLKTNIKYIPLNYAEMLQNVEIINLLLKSINQKNHCECKTIQEFRDLQYKNNHKVLNKELSSKISNAMENNNLDFIKKLIAAGLNTNSMLCHGQSLLIEAIRKNNHTVIKYLLDAGANPLFLDLNNNYPCSFAEENESIYNLIIKNLRPYIANLITKQKKSILADDLFFAIKHTVFDFIDAFLAETNNPNFVLHNSNHSGNSLLITAILEEDCIAMVRHLLENRADPLFTSGHKDPIEIAISLGDVTVVECLLEHINFTDFDGAAAYNALEEFKRTSTSDETNPDYQNNLELYNEILKLLMTSHDYDQECPLEQAIYQLETELSKINLKANVENLEYIELDLTNLELVLNQLSLEDFNDLTKTALSKFAKKNLQADDPNHQRNLNTYSKICNLIVKVRDKKITADYVGRNISFMPIVLNNLIAQYAASE